MEKRMQPMDYETCDSGMHAAQSSKASSQLTSRTRRAADGYSHVFICTSVGGLNPNNGNTRARRPQRLVKRTCDRLEKWSPWSEHQSDQAHIRPPQQLPNNLVSQSSPPCDIIQLTQEHFYLPAHNNKSNLFSHYNTKLFPNYNYPTTITTTTTIPSKTTKKKKMSTQKADNNNNTLEPASLPTPPSTTAPSQSYPASCHCGAFAYTVTASPPLSDPAATVMQCNCSICERNGYLFIYAPNERVVFTKGKVEDFRVRSG